MIFKARKDEELRALNEGWSRQEQLFDQAIEQAVAAEDPAESLLALRSVSHEIAGKIDEEQKVAAKKGDVAFKTTAGVSTGVATAAGVAAILLGPAAWIAAPIIVGGVAAGAFGGKAQSGARKKGLQAAFEAHAQHMAEQVEMIDMISEDIIGKNIKALAESERYEDLMQDVGLLRSFANAAAKALMGQGEKKVLDSETIGEELKTRHAEQAELYSRFIRLSDDGLPASGPKPQQPKP
jgi:hypothetical protein